LATQRGTIGNLIRLGYSWLWWIVWWATMHSSRFVVAITPPVFGLRSNRGKLLDEISTRI
jgi:hypothetical protein